MHKLYNQLSITKIYFLCKPLQAQIPSLICVHAMSSYAVNQVFSYMVYTFDILNHSRMAALCQTEAVIWSA